MQTQILKIDMITLLCNTFTNVFAETAMGTSLQDLGVFQQQYREAVHRMGELAIYR